MKNKKIETKKSIDNEHKKLSDWDKYNFNLLAHDRPEMVSTMIPNYHAPMVYGMEVGGHFLR